MSKDQKPAPTRGVPVELDRTRYFRYTLGTLRKLREELGVEALEAGVSGDKLTKVFWYGLKGDDPELTTEKIDELIDLENLDVVVDAMRKAMGHKAKVEVLGPPTPTPAAEGASQ